MNELLCFLSNRLGNTPNDILIKLCTDFYEQNEIADAKSLIFKTCEKVFESRDEAPRLKTRKGPNKLQSDMKDIIEILHEMGSDVPSFVAMDLARVPFLGKDSINLAAVIQDIQIIKRELAEIKDQGLRPACSSVSTCDVLPAQNNSKTNEDSEQVTVLPESDGTDLEETAPKSAISAASDMVTDTGPSATSSSSDDSPSFAAAAAINHSDETSYTMVKARRPRQKHGIPQSVAPRQDDVVIGNGGHHGSLRAAKREPRPNHEGGVFVTRVHAGTSFSIIKDHIFRETGLRLKCITIHSRNEHLYSSFRVLCDARDASRLLCPNIWPKGVLVRQYESR